MLRVLLLTVGVGGLAFAAPVPKAAPAPTPQAQAVLTLGTATLNGQRVQITYDATPPLGANAPNPVNVQPSTRTMTVALAAVKVTTADGKELTGDDLTKRLGESPAVARSTVAIDPEWKKVFADDVLFIEPNGKAVVGGGVGVGGGAVIRPLPIRPGVIRPALPPVEEVPVEKPVEKKEEKKEEKK